MRQTSGPLFWLLCAAIACSITARPATAGIATWSAYTDSSPDGELSAQADFTITTGQIQVKITNLLDPTEIGSQGQAVSDLSFTLSTGPVTDVSNTASGVLVKLVDGGGGTFNIVAGTPGRWVGLEPGLGAFGISGGGKTITLEAIGGGKPTEMILPADNGGIYSSANSGFQKNFSPYVDGPATFTLNLTGVTSSTTITGATFSFGTSPDVSLPATFVPGGPGPGGGGRPVAPEPGSLAVWALLGLAGIVYRSRRIAA
jgi:hypothetical protein